MEPIKPCPHMKTLVTALQDGKLTGLIHRYASWHVANCPRCQAALAALTQMSRRLKHLGSAPASESPALSPDRWEAMEAAWDEADGKAT